MTTAMPGGNSADDESDGRPMDDDEISRRFDDIVAGISGDMQWDEGEDTRDDVGDDAAAFFFDPSAGASPTGEDTAEQRRLRREQRKANRSFEAAAFAAEQARREAEYAEDDQHYVPDEPPPLTMPKVRTLIALLLIACGLFLVFGPNLLTISPNGVMVMSAALVISGGALLISGLRRRHGSGDPDDPGEGWDDGSRV